MPPKTFRPRTPSLRYKSVADFSELTKKAPEKSLIKHKHRKVGRNAQGRLTSAHKGSGHKRRYRVIDFLRDKEGVPGRVAALEYDPNRTSRIALINYADGAKRYIVAPAEVTVGTTITSGDHSDLKPGNTLTFKAMPVGTLVHNIEMKPGKGAQVARSAGAVAQLMAKESDWALVRLPSGELRKVSLECRATVGQVGNLDHENIVIGKAGRSRWMGKRPHVRGVVMNPCDHPLGGGEGKTSGGRHPCSPWGQPCKGYKTRNNKATDKWIVQRRTK